MGYSKFSSQPPHRLAKLISTAPHVLTSLKGRGRCNNRPLGMGSSPLLLALLEL